MTERRKALITGASRGIGRAICVKLASEGTDIVFSYRSGDEAASETVNLCREYGIEIHAIKADVSNSEECERLIREAVDLLGGRIDILVNSAGVVVKHDFWGIDEKEYDGIMDTNAKGTFFMSQAVGKAMIEKQVKGHILNVTSSSALRPAWTPYQMSKWAVRGLTLGLADTLLPYGIVVNAIAPGPTATPMLGKTEGSSISEPNNPSKRYAMPEEIASMAVYMVSDAGRMIVGDTVYMTGGSGTITLHH